eukprot:scaffold28332_cov138-Isochrysis_galbana.AAC.1
MSSANKTMADAPTDAESGDGVVRGQRQGKRAREEPVGAALEGVSSGVGASTASAGSSSGFAVPFTLADDEEEDGEDEDYDPTMDEGGEDDDGEDEDDDDDGEEEEEEDPLGAGGAGAVDRAGEQGSNTVPHNEPATLIEEVMALHQDARLSLQDVLGQHTALDPPASAVAQTGKGKSVLPPPAAEHRAVLADDSD